MDSIARHSAKPNTGPSSTFRRDAGGVVDIAPREWPFRVLKRPGKRHYRVRFLVGHLRFEGSTGCIEADLALTVAKVLYAQIRETVEHDRPAPMQPDHRIFRAVSPRTAG